MESLKRVCVFCGSSKGARPAYAAGAQALGAELARRKLGLVYGGAKVGLMGVVADAAMAAGTTAVGVIPEVVRALEVAHEGLTELRVVGSMHERKKQMADLSDGFIAMPGGMGTFEELCEILTWAQLGMHQKPIGLLNVAGYYEGFLLFLDHAVTEGFFKPRDRARVLVAQTPAALLDLMEAYVAPAAPQVLDRRTT